MHCIYMYHAHPAIIVTLVYECRVIVPEVGAAVIRYLREALVAPQLIVRPGCC